MARKDDTTTAAETPAAETTVSVAEYCAALPRWQRLGFCARYAHAPTAKLTRAELEAQMASWLGEGETATIEAHCKDLPPWKYAGFRARYDYGLGKLLTKAMFEAQMTGWVNGPVDE